MGFLQFIGLGFSHIIPLGFDHILFILAISLSSRKFNPLLIQISLFTLAHTASLALATLDIIQLNSQWVESGIALSIIFMAAENLRNIPIRNSRYIWVFGFGLLHGLGFAAMLKPMMMLGDTITVPLLGFNIGVELGQLVVLLLSFAVQYFIFNYSDNRVKILKIVFSIFIILMGSYWLFVRLFL